MPDRIVTELDTEGWEARLFIIRVHRWMSRLIGLRVVSSACLMFLPVVGVGAYLQYHYETTLLSIDVLIALAWLAVAPLLIADAVRLTHELLRGYKLFFVSSEEWAAFTNRQIGRLDSSAYIYFGLPWAVAVTLVILQVMFPEEPVAVRVWAGVSFFLLFFVSAIGFRGVIVLISVVQELCESDIRFIAHHPDRFGGMNGIGSYSVRGALYFSSGALVFPLAFEIFRRLGGDEGLMEVAWLGLVTVFIVFMVAAFFVPVSAIKRFVGDEKTRVLMQSREKLDDLIGRFEDGDEFDPKTATEILIHYHLGHSQLTRIKNYPYDARVVFELALSVLIPVAVAAMELLLV